MPDNGNEKPFSASREARARRNWWSKAKDFIVRDCGMYEMGDNTELHISDYHINANIVLIGNQPTPGPSCIEQGETQEQSYPGMLVNQDSIGSKYEEPQITLAQSPTELQMNSDLSPLSSDPDNTFESEAIAEYTDPDVPSISSTSYPYSSRARTHIYSFEMLTHREGYPLYMPTPLGGLPAAYRKKGIRVGDVGMMTAKGAFDFVLNACQHDDQSDAGINPAVVPDGFELLKPLIRTSDEFDPGVCLTSDNVCEISGGNFSEFQCLAAEGAVLVLPKGATKYEAVNKHRFQTHAARHAENWYKYILNEGRDISNGSLYFVTECIKSVNWGIAVFYANSNTADNLRFIFDEESCRWVRRDKVEARIGPKPKDIIVSDDEEPNQCVFLRGFKIMLRPDIWDKLKGTIAVTSKDGESSLFPSTRTSHSPSPGSGSQTGSFHRSRSDNSTTTNSGHGTRLQASQLMLTQTPPGCPTNVANASGPEISSHRLGRVILEENFREEAPLHPSDLINIMLLNLKPEARVALAHDSDWCNHLPDDFFVDPVNPNVDGLLENVKRSCKVVIDQNESAVLVNPEMESKAEESYFLSKSHNQKMQPYVMQHDVIPSLRHGSSLPDLTSMRSTTSAPITHSPSPTSAEAHSSAAFPQSYSAPHSQNRSPRSGSGLMGGNHSNDTPQDSMIDQSSLTDKYSSPSLLPVIRRRPSQTGIEDLSACTLNENLLVPPLQPFNRAGQSDALLILHAQSPDLSLRPSSPVQSSQVQTDVERRPNKGDGDYIERPENAFILFRRKCCEDLQQEDASDSLVKKQRQANLSKTISQRWNSLSPEERQYWEQLAREKKKDHEQMYPSYVYRPQRFKNKGKDKDKKPVKNPRPDN